MDRRPQMVLSPRRLRPRRAIPPRYPVPAPPVQKSPAKNTKNTQADLYRASVSGATLFRPDYELISSELLSIAKNAKGELRESIEDENLNPNYNNNNYNNNKSPIARNSTSSCSPLFERGRFYDLYSARRNERLKRKQLEFAEFSEFEDNLVQNPEIAVELGKKRVAKKSEMTRKLISGDVSVSRIPTLRSSVRNSKEMKKAISSSISGSVSVSASYSNSGSYNSLVFNEKPGVGSSVRRIGTRSSARRI